MKNYLSDPTFYPFFLKKVQERLSGTTVMTIEQAEEIQRSIEYVLENGGEGTVPVRFDQGKKQLAKRFDALQRIYKVLLKNVKTFGIESLEESLAEIDHFFANYDMEYAAAEVDHAFLDYQLAEAVPLDFVGLDFYERYLQNLAAEVFFITYIPETQIVELLNVYQEKLGFDYRRDINNLFDCVFKQFVGKVLAEKIDNETLLLNTIEAHYALHQLKTQSSFPALDLLFQKNTYYQRAFSRFQDYARHLEGTESAGSFFLVDTSTKKRLELPPMMPADRFNQLIEACSNADQEEKIAKINEVISSPEDLEEYINISYETTDFYKRLFKELDDDLLKVSILFVVHRNNLNSHLRIVDLTTNRPLDVLLKDLLKSLTIDERYARFSDIEDYELFSYDFS